jgi:hypothetical protein
LIKNLQLIETNAHIVSLPLLQQTILEIVSVVLLKNTVAMPLKIWQQNWFQNFVDVPGCIQDFLE